MKLSGLIAGVLAGALMVSAPLAGAAQAQTAAAADAVHFDVYLPLQHSDELDQLLGQLHDPASPKFRQWLTPAQFMARFGPSAADIASVKNALTARGLAVTQTNAHGVHVVGAAAAVSATFGAPLAKRVDSEGKTHFLAPAGFKLPPELAAVNARVVAFEPATPQRVHSRVTSALAGPVPDNRYSDAGPYWFDDLKQAYDFPSYQALSGRGRTIAIVMSSDFLDSDLALYFGHEKLAPPHVTRVPVCVVFTPGTPATCGAPFSTSSGASFEVSLDLQQSGGMAPKAHLKLFNIPDLSDQSILTGYAQIVDDNAADIVSSSFGGPELGYFASYNGGTDFTYLLQEYEDIYRQGNAQGITFVASSGDSGGLPIPSVNYFYPDGKPVSWVPGVEVPAASPHVTGVGGTNLVTTTPPSPQTTPPTLTSAYVGENAFGDPEIPYDPYGQGINVPGGYWGSGGGTSDYYAKPFYQYFVDNGASTRTVPDISLQMGGCPGGISQLPCPLDGLPRSYVVTAVGGSLYGLIGTSVSAPGFAGVLALEEEALGGVRLGNVNYQIYLQAGRGGSDDDAEHGNGPTFHTHIKGFNGYDVATGHGNYNRVLGVGTPYVRKFIGAPYLPAAGTPQSPSNP